MTCIVPPCVDPGAGQPVVGEMVPRLLQLEELEQEKSLLSDEIDRLNQARSYSLNSSHLAYVGTNNAMDAYVEHRGIARAGGGIPHKLNRWKVFKI